MLSLCLSSASSTRSSSSSLSSSPSPSRRPPSSTPLYIPSSCDEEMRDDLSMDSGIHSLSSSAESLHSIHSSTSTRSCAEREAERAERRHLLNVSIGKIQGGGGNLPLRRHLLLFNTIKQIQKDLDCLDSEELYSCLLEEQSPMEVDDEPWLEERSRGRQILSSDEWLPAWLPQEGSTLPEQTLTTTNDVFRQSNDDGFSFHQERRGWSWSSSGSGLDSESVSEGGWTEPAHASKVSAPASSDGWVHLLSEAGTGWRGASSSPRDDSPGYGFGFDSDDLGCGVFEWDSAPLDAVHLSGRDLLHLLPMQA